VNKIFSFIDSSPKIDIKYTRYYYSLIKYKFLTKDILIISIKNKNRSIGFLYTLLALIIKILPNQIRKSMIMK